MVVVDLKPWSARGQKLRSTPFAEFALPLLCLVKLSILFDSKPSTSNYYSSRSAGSAPRGVRPPICSTALRKVLKSFFYKTVDANLLSIRSWVDKWGGLTHLVHHL